MKMNFPAIGVSVTDACMYDDMHASISEVLRPTLSKPTFKFQPCDHRVYPYRQKLCGQTIS